MGPITVHTSPTLTFPFVTWVPRAREPLYTEGMQGWFQLDAKTVFSVTFGDARVIPFQAMNLWDSHPSGRVGKIVDHSVHRQRQFVLNYFHQIDEWACSQTHALHTKAQ